MTAIASLSAGASPTSSPLQWDDINWRKIVADVRQLQMRIAKAFREGKHGKAKALQWILTHSFSAKLFAVKRVVQNQGAKTPGVDGTVWNTSIKKMKAATSLRRCGYQTKPLKRIYIPKKQKGKLRPLSIPVMQCRAMQSLYLLSLEPIAENIADKNAYGFRPMRSTADAIGHCFNSLAQRSAAQYILEGDIHACFDTISHRWLLDNTPMDKVMLGKWLAAGYIEKGKLHPTEFGTPQGGLISPTLLTVTLSGLEQTIKSVVKQQDKVNVCVYADDFIVTGSTKEVLKNKVKPIVEAFLRGRGLSLSQEKTKITHIDEGFDFLGMNIRKYNGKLIIKPAKSSIKRLLADIREKIKLNKTAKTENLIRLLNPKVRGWANYYRHVCSKKTFNHVDNNIFQSIWRWAVRRHPKKSAKWIKQKYFRTVRLRNWVFSVTFKNRYGESICLDLIKAQKVPIKRHIKIKSAATPYDPYYKEYFEKRIGSRVMEGESMKRSFLGLGCGNLIDNR
ncbi:RNA-directed DNA polymerase [Gammaproteobacteria bacterium]